jgi:hypothetical protein
LEESCAYLAKATESLSSAETDFAAARYNSCANRAYYACFQAAIAALLSASIRPNNPREEWSHEFVQSQFNGLLINRRKLYAMSLRRTLILLANSGIRYRSHYKDAVASGSMTRAKADRRVLSRATPANQSATRSRLMAAAVARGWR